MTTFLRLVRSMMAPAPARPVRRTRLALTALDGRLVPTVDLTAPAAPPADAAWMDGEDSEFDDSEFDPGDGGAVDLTALYEREAQIIARVAELDLQMDVLQVEIRPIAREVDESRAALVLNQNLHATYLDELAGARQQLTNFDANVDLYPPGYMADLRVQIVATIATLEAGVARTAALADVAAQYLGWMGPVLETMRQQMIDLDYEKLFLGLELTEVRQKIADANN